MTLLRENDGTLSPLASATPWLESEFFLCVRMDGSHIIATAEDLTETNEPEEYDEWLKGEFTCSGCGLLLSRHRMCCGGTKGGVCLDCCPPDHELTPA
jgi:hypothetical protein